MSFITNYVLIKEIRKIIFNIIFCTLFFILIFSLTKSNIIAACPESCLTHAKCGCVGEGGCVYRTTCLSDEVSIYCGSAGTMCCDRGTCNACTPTCSTGYQGTANGCSSKVVSCNRTYCTGGECTGTDSITCYRSKYTVTVVPNSGSCSFTSKSYCGDTSTENPNCTRLGYSLTGYTLTGSCGGTFTSSTGICSKITSSFTITANWLLTNQQPTKPTVPYCNGTTNPTDVTTQTPYFSAIYNDPDSSDTSTYYEIEVNTASDFSGTIMWDSGIQSMSSTTNGSRSPNIYYNGSSLEWTGATYYWRIRFSDIGGLTSPWSDVQNFTMHTNTAPSAPTSLQTELATNPVEVIDLTPEFRAIFQDPNTGDTANQYEIEVNTASNFSGTVMWDSDLQSMTSTAIGSYSPEISYNGTELTLNGTTYYWRIRFVDNYGYVGTWSSTANFKMNNIPTVTNPKTNGLVNPLKVGTTPYFTAVFNDNDTTATGTYYEIEVNTNSSFTGTVMWDTNQVAHSPAITNGGTSSNITYSGSALASGGLYYWRIRFWDNVGTVSNWSTTSNFRITTGPSAPTNLLVEGNVNPISLLSLTPPFSAIYIDLNGDNASNYEIEVNTNSSFTGTVMWDTGKTLTTVYNGNRSPDYTYNGVALTGSSNITYYWRIRFWDTDDNIGEWSATATFKDSLTHFFLNGIQINGIQID